MKKKIEYDRYENAQLLMNWWKVGVGYIEVNDANGDALDEGTLKTNISMYLAESIINGQIEQAKDIKRRLQRKDLYDQAMQIIRESSVAYTTITIHNLKT